MHLNQRRVRRDAKRNAGLLVCGKHSGRQVLEQYVKRPRDGGWPGVRQRDCLYVLADCAVVGDGARRHRDHARNVGGAELRLESVQHSTAVGKRAGDGARIVDAPWEGARRACEVVLQE